MSEHNLDLTGAQRSINRVRFKQLKDMRMPLDVVLWAASKGTYNNGINAAKRAMKSKK